MGGMRESSAIQPVPETQFKVTDPSLRLTGHPMTTNTAMVRPYTLLKYSHVLHKGLDSMTD